MQAISRLKSLLRAVRAHGGARHAQLVDVQIIERFCTRGNLSPFGHIVAEMRQSNGGVVIRYRKRFERVC